MKKMVLCLLGLCTLSSCTFPYFYWNEKNEDLIRVRNNYYLTYDHEVNIDFFPHVSEEEAREEGLVSSLFMGVVTLPVSAITLPFQYPFLASQRAIDYTEARSMVDEYFARGQYDKVLQVDPNYSRAYYERGLIFHARKDYSAAIRDYSGAIYCDEEFKEAYAKRGLVHYEMQHFPAAMSDWRRAVELGYSANKLQPLIEEATRQLQR
ncbi:tetratricopeptide repeat protein [Candidatus Uabimicrobium amorphum]|uniref:Tetratricopeptide repeat protein n=1 Tax=Uabimicrobium amorphum TaxID=2596890 RepID=A0A5S9F2P0_UABAM|nr:hypothetical protein [Candidatus Uabimicrobium amorphum]BBM83431.1 hypothetical protein UABAM_01783 [Candidatus Uabimicrobium amorphum]